ncbi:MAG: putative dehydrogenase [Planctomycetota bacterium]|jgi:predicted dehydrogenase
MKSDRRRFLVQSAGALGTFALAPELAARVRSGLAPLRVGLIGAGRQGRAILAELVKLEDVQVTAVADAVESRLRSGLRRVQGATGYADHTSLLAEAEVDAVIIATPTHLHREPALAALERGKHVYCEAPLAHTLEDCRALVAAARASKGKFMTGMLARSNPIYDLARDFSRSGAIRDVVSMRAQNADKNSWIFPARDPADEKALNWRLDPEVSLGLPGEMGVHQFDVFHWFLGAYPTAVRGRGSVQLHEDGRTVADTISLELEFPGDRVLSYEATLANSYESTYELMRGTMGTFRLAWTAGWMFKESDAATLDWEVYASRQQFHDEAGITLIADATQLAAQGRLKEGIGLPETPLYYALGDFVEACNNDTSVPTSAGEGLRAAVIGIQSQHAVTSGERVEISAEMLAE